MKIEGNKQYFSPSTGGVYPGALHMSYVSGGTWPDDAEELTKEDHNEFFKLKPPKGKVRTRKGGKHTWKDVTVDEVELYKGKIVALEEAITPRRMREAVLTSSGKAWLVAQEAKISSNRKLVQTFSAK